MKALNGKPPNRRLQLTAFGARDRGFFEVVLCSAPRRQLKRNTLGRNHQRPHQMNTCSRPLLPCLVLQLRLLLQSTTMQGKRE